MHINAIGTVYADMGHLNDIKKQIKTIPTEYYKILSNVWTTKNAERVFNCPYYLKEINYNSWECDPCSGCADPNCPKHPKIIC